MYKNFFGFKERPFQLVPNPAYLFLSKSHEEAMAHLTYAVIQGDGFVEITGEVGTGKTTLCRAFLENLDKNIEVAYIFNPKLDAVQLLKAINDEFGINSKPDTIKELIDTLNTFLIKKKSEGKNIILLIDEAQNLSKEVLEQLRLLSNLETATTKLLQIILVGQPELSDMLDSYDLRQLGQRITLSCHLVPLNLKETREYIEHRIRIASRKPGLKFTRDAYKAVYHYSRGFPRLINILCDRVLLTAFSLEQHKITGSIVKLAIKELAGRRGWNAGSSEGKKKFLIFSVLCLILSLLIIYPPGNNIFKIPEQSVSQLIKKVAPPPVSDEKKDIEKPKDAETVEIPVESDVEEKSEKETEPVSEVVQNLGYFLKEIDSRSSRNTALKLVMSLWNTPAIIKEYLNDMDDEQIFFRVAARQNGLLIHRIDEDPRIEPGAGFDLIKKLNLPAVLLFHGTGSNPLYLVISEIDDDKITLRGGNEDNTIVAEPNEVEYYWSGVAYIPWKNFYAYSGTIPRDAPDESVIALKTLLRDIGYNDIEITPAYDDPARKAVEEIQEKHGINIDGVVGPVTRIILYNELKSLDIPHIKD